MKTLRSLLSAAILSAALPAAAAGRLAPPEMQEAVYATRVDSTIEIGPDGRVLRYEPITELKDPLAARVRAIAENFRFEPVQVDGVPVIARTRMRMHLVAEPMESGDLRVSVEHVGFPEEGGAGDGYAAEPHAYIRGIAKRVPLAYPTHALRLGVSGRVLVAVRLAPDGSVAEALPRESALYGVKGRERSLSTALSLLERGAVEAIRRWTFDVDVPAGAYPKPEDLTGVMVVEYFIDGRPQPKPGLWMHESRSRERALPWLNPMLAEHLPDMADVGAGGHFGATPRRFRLLTPPTGLAL